MAKKTKTSECLSNMYIFGHRLWLFCLAFEAMISVEQSILSMSLFKKKKMKFTFLCFVKN